MKFLKNCTIFLGLLITSLYASDKHNTINQQKAHAFKTIQAMQEAIDFQNQDVFIDLLQQYLMQFGQMYEKESGLFSGYKKTYYIASINNQSEPITPESYDFLINTLYKAAHNSHWGKNLQLQVPIVKHGIVIQTSVHLPDIIKAIKQIPLPTNYATTTLLTGAAATAALAAGTYYAYTAYNKKPEEKNLTLDSNNKETVKEFLPTQQDPITTELSSENKSTEQVMTNDVDALVNVVATKPRRLSGLEQYATMIKSDYNAEHAPSSSSYNTLAQPTIHQIKITKKINRFGDATAQYLSLAANDTDIHEANAYIAPDQLDSAIAHPFVQTALLPFDVANRLIIATNNLSNPDFKFGSATQKLINQADDSQTLEGNAYITPDQGDYSLMTTGANALATGVAYRAVATPTKIKLPHNTNMLLGSDMSSTTNLTQANKNAFLYGQKYNKAIVPYQPQSIVVYKP